MFCIQCGHNLSADARFCSKCGVKTDGPDVQGSMRAVQATAGTAPAGIESGATHAAFSLSGRLPLKVIVAGLLCGAIGIWIATRSSGQSPSAPDASAPTPVSQVAAPSPATDAPSPAPEPVRSYVSVQRGSPLCGSFKGAITAESVMRSGNPTVIAMVLDRQGCEQAPQSYQFDAEKTLVQPLQAGVVQLTLADGTQIFTTQESVSTSRH